MTKGRQPHPKDVKSPGGHGVRAGEGQPQLGAREENSREPRGRRPEDEGGGREEDGQGRQRRAGED